MQWGMVRRVGLAVWVTIITAAGTMAASGQNELASRGMPGGDPDAVFPAWPFSVGEEAEYDVTFGPIQIGRAYLRIEAEESIRETSTYRLAFEISGGIPVYKINDRTVSWLASSPYRSMRFEQILREGGYRRHRRFELYHDVGTVTREDWDEEGGSYEAHPEHRDLPIPVGALDEISYLYLIRTVPLEVGRTYTFDGYFEDEGNPVVLEVLRRERVRVRAGTFKTIVVRPIIQADGLFAEDGEAEVYISDDERRLIVQLKTKMGIGEVNMYLRQFEVGA